VCEVIDPMFHQAPFIALAYFALKHPGLGGLKTELVKGGLALIVVTALIGPAQRFFWDLSTCGNTVCDGPYHGFLSHISPYEQFFWHTAPGFFFCGVMAVV
jgi:hypothetical protein